MESELRELLEHSKFELVKRGTIGYSVNPLVAGDFSSDLMDLEAAVAVLDRNDFGGLSNMSQVIIYDEFERMKQIFMERDDKTKDISVIAVGNPLALLPYLKDTFWKGYGKFQHFEIETSYDGGASFNLVLDPKEKVLYVFEKPLRRITKLNFW